MGGAVPKVRHLALWVCMVVLRLHLSALHTTSIQTVLKHQGAS